MAGSPPFQNFRSPTHGDAGGRRTSARNPADAPEPARSSEPLRAVAGVQVNPRSDSSASLPNRESSGAGDRTGAA